MQVAKQAKIYAYHSGILTAVILLKVSQFQYNTYCLSFQGFKSFSAEDLCCFVYSTYRITLYVDKRMESMANFELPADRQRQEMKIGVAPRGSLYDMVNFTGSIKKMIYYRSTKYNDMVRGDGR